MSNYSVGDEVEVYINQYSRPYSLTAKIVFINSEGVWILWHEGVEVDPRKVSKGFPTLLEGKKVFCLNPNSNFHSNKTGWGKVLGRVNAPPSKGVQLHLPESGGMNCIGCYKYTQYASVNMSDGTFACRECRMYKKWKLPHGSQYIGFIGERK